MTPGWKARPLVALVGVLAGTSSWAADAAEAAFSAAARYTVKIQATVRLPVRSGDAAGVFTGAGFAADAERGWIVTNAHVTSRSVASIRVRSRSGAWISAKRVYVDPYLDVAIIAPAGGGALEGLDAAALACESAPAVGHAVGAFGHPWGLDFTGTRGIVAGMSDRYEPGALLTDAPINDGNSGGPLISLSTGKVVGINTSALAVKDVQNLNFAVSARYVCRILDLLRSGRDPSPLARTLVFSADSEQTGVVRVARNFMSPEYLQLRTGDVIKEVVGEPGPITSESEIVHALRGRVDEVALRIDRRGRELVLSGRLPRMERVLGRQVLYASGVVFGEARTFDASEINYSKIASCQIGQGSLGESAGFERCDAIESVDGETAKDLRELHGKLESARRSSRPALIAVKRIAGLRGKSFFEYRELSLPVEELHWVRVDE